MSRSRVPLFALTLSLGAGCEREDLYGGATFTETVASAFAECNPNEIRFLASKHNIQTAFENCGSNNFVDFDWSPSGIWLAFSLSNSAYIMNAEDKTIGPLPLESPLVGPSWIREDVLAVILAPTAAAGAPDPASVAGPRRLAVYNRAAGTLTTMELSLSEPRDLQGYGEDDRVLFTGVDEAGVRRPYLADPATQEVTRAFPWLDGPVDRLRFSAEASLVGWSDEAGASVAKSEDGALVTTVAGALRAIPHHEGRYIAFETMGAPISPFDQRTWDEMSPEARERELARQKQWLERLPDYIPREQSPPEVQIYDTTKGVRYRVTAFFGDHFEWYHPRNYFCSFMLWGIEGKQVNRNVALADIFEKLRMMDKEGITLGMELITDEPTVEGDAPQGDAANEATTTEEAAQTAPADAP